MARWKDSLTPEQEKVLKSLFDRLKVKKPKGWSCVWGDREIVVRPTNRTLGKFSVTSVDATEVSVAFFSQLRNVWTDRQDFPRDVDASAVADWMIARTRDSDVNVASAER